MTSQAVLWLALTLVVAVIDWFAVAARNKVVEYIAKPLTMVLLVAVALAIDPADPVARAWFVAALAFGLGGDVFLMLPGQRRWFVFGLGSFLIGHLCYVVGLLVGSVAGGGLIAGVAIVVVSMATLGRHIFGMVRAAEPGLLAPVVAYIGVISLMVIAAFGTLSPAAIVGAVLFYASDAMIAFDRFGQSRPWMRVAIIITYHAGQALLVLSLV